MQNCDEEKSENEKSESSLSPRISTVFDIISILDFLFKVFFEGFLLGSAIAEEKSRAEGNRRRHSNLNFHLLPIYKLRFSASLALTLLAFLMSHAKGYEGNATFNEAPSLWRSLAANNFLLSSQVSTELDQFSLRRHDTDIALCI